MAVQRASKRTLSRVLTVLQKILIAVQKELRLSCQYWVYNLLHQKTQCKPA